MFPDRDVAMSQRSSTEVDILLGCDYFGLHPKYEECSNGDNLSIMRGELGVCLQGSHPDLTEDTCISANLAKVTHSYKLRISSNFVNVQALHPEFDSPSNCNITASSQSYFARGKKCDLSENELNNFIQGEELATEVIPKCGGCKCSKCPIMGHTYSFQEEQELNMIQNNLHYDEEKHCWFTSYPWIIDPAQLPNNYKTAYATLLNTEKILKKDGEWTTKYADQIQDMLDRKVARELSDGELTNWTGPVFYISHLAVKNYKSKSTPVRIVFNSSQVCQGVSLNTALAKGPDGYLNNLLGLLLRWREEEYAVVGDIKKMFNSVHLEEVEQHCHRFLWRNLETDKKPKVYVMTRVNMGDKPAPAISTEALYKTAKRFESECPVAAKIIRKSTYVDDIIDSFPSKNSAAQAAADTEKMLAKAGFLIKCWQFSGDDCVTPAEGSKVHSPVSLLKGTDDITRVLGVAWIPQRDMITFQVALNFSPKRRGERTGPDLKEEDLVRDIPQILTRRIVLEQVMSMYDPLGLLSPFTLIAKLYLRETWTLKLQWDDPLPEKLHRKWIEYFSIMFRIADVELDRKLKPPDAVGNPWLIILSDASDNAYGFAAYIRWVLKNGDVWCRLIMAKSRIAPISKLSTPQMELNAAVLSKRGRKVIEKEMRFKFERTLHLVDSETVLCMLNKTSTRFKVYEGVRIGEIQAATGGDMSEWAWVSGSVNTADWLTRGRRPDQLSSTSEWWNGPSFLYQPIDYWQMKFGLQKREILPGEKRVVATSVVNGNFSDFLDYSMFNSFHQVCWVLARLCNILRVKSFKGGHTMLITPDMLHEAEIWIMKDVQKSMTGDLSLKNGRYHSLCPILDHKGLWIIGRRLEQFNPMTPENDPQVLLPSQHKITKLLMKEAHSHGHRGRDATLARFRQNYWTPYGSKLAGQVRQNCQMCRLREAKFLEQQMGLLPKERLKPAPAFNQVMIDLFGPYQIRGEINKRSSGKAYGVIFTDMVMRAVHIEGVFGYDTGSFLLALSRFVSHRGWPEVIYSDPGSQLVCVDKELRAAWVNIDRTSLCRKGAENGLKWVFGPADSPWHQGAVESLVKAAKRAFRFTFNNQRLSAAEFLTVCVEVANLLNERPIGTMPSTDADISVLTPNCLLMGRATAQNPRSWQPEGSLSNRFHFVQSVVSRFWQKWCELCAPALVVQRKWHTASRNLKRGDVVIMADRNSLRGEYKLALVHEVYPSMDGKVRKVSLVYKSFKAGEKLHQYKGATDVIVTRGVQNLALLVPVD